MPLSTPKPAEYRLKSYAVLPQTREAFLRALPGLKNDDFAAWRFLAHRYFSTFIDKETGRTVAPAPLFALFQEKKYSKNYSASCFIERLRSQITPIDLAAPKFSPFG